MNAEIQCIFGPILAKIFSEPGYEFWIVYATSVDVVIQNFEAARNGWCEGRSWEESQSTIVNVWFHFSTEFFKFDILIFAYLKCPYSEILLLKHKRLKDKRIQGPGSREFEVDYIAPEVGVANFYLDEFFATMARLQRPLELNRPSRRSRTICPMLIENFSSWQ